AAGCGAHRHIASGLGRGGRTGQPVRRPQGSAVMDTVVALLAGGGVGAGLWLIISGWRRRPEAHARNSRSGVPGVAWPAVAPKLVAAVVAWPLVAVVTGWPAAGLLSAVAVVGLPSLLGRDRDHQTSLDRVEAVAAWTELLRDTLAAAA